jgi:hypothetical protein
MNHKAPVKFAGKEFSRGPCKVLPVDKSLKKRNVIAEKLVGILATRMLFFGSPFLKDLVQEATCLACR